MAEPTRPIPLFENNILTALNDENGLLTYLKAINNSLFVTIANGLTASGNISDLNNEEIIYVTTGDTSTDSNYVEGSEGNIKTVKVYNYNASIGDYAILYTYQYSDPTNYRKVTKKITSVTGV